MRLIYWLIVAVFAGTNSVAQTPGPEATLQYIHGAWYTLTRLITDGFDVVASQIRYRN